MRGVPAAALLLLLLGCALGSGQPDDVQVEPPVYDETGM